MERNEENSAKVILLETLTGEEVNLVKPAKTMAGCEAVVHQQEDTIERLKAALKALVLNHLRVSDMNV